MNLNVYLYWLYAINKQGETKVYEANTQSEVLKMFDKCFNRGGFQIFIIDNTNGNKKIIKKTYR